MFEDRCADFIIIVSRKDLACKAFYILPFRWIARKDILGREDIKINDRALALEKSLIEKLELVFDTDVELDVYNLGLIYEIHLDEAGTCKVVMTFTDTACSCAESLPIEIVSRLKEIDGIEDVKVEVTWSPAWKITRISRYGRIALGLPPR